MTNQKSELLIKLLTPDKRYIKKVFSSYYEKNPDKFKGYTIMKFGETFRQKHCDSHGADLCSACGFSSLMPITIRRQM